MTSYHCSLNKNDLFYTDSCQIRLFKVKAGWLDLRKLNLHYILVVFLLVPLILQKLKHSPALLSLIWTTSTVLWSALLDANQMCSSHYKHLCHSLELQLGLQMIFQTSRRVARLLLGKWRRECSRPRLREEKAQYTLQIKSQDYFMTSTQEE